MDAVSKVEHVAARDGTSLLVRHWQPKDGTPWASVLLVHGLAEHSGRYEHVGRQLAAAGIETEAFDLRGFGGSGGPRASVASWSELHDDLHERLAALRAVDPLRPLVVYAHSLGGLVALGYVLDDQAGDQAGDGADDRAADRAAEGADGRPLPELLVLSAPAIGARIPIWQRAVVGSLRRVAPDMQMSNRLKATDLSSDPEVGTKYFADPLNQHTSSVRFAHAAFRAQHRVNASLDRLAIPTLVIHGGDDHLVPTATSETLDGRPGVTRHVYPGLRHELHNERVGREVVDDVVAWIREQVASLPARSASESQRTAEVSAGRR